MKNKKIWKWLVINLLLIISGASIISNAIFIPKYHNLKKSSENEISLKVQISAIDDRSNKILFTFNYLTTIINLGQLMAQYKETYILTNGTYGRFIEGIKYIDDNKEEKQIKNDVPNSYFWMIYYNTNSVNIGIDGINLNTNDVIELHYQK